MAPDTNKAKDSTASIFDLLDSKPVIDSSSSEGTTLDDVKGDIEFHHVSFRYSTRPDVQIFRDLSLSIPSGKVVSPILILGIFLDVSPIHIPHIGPKSDQYMSLKSVKEKTRIGNKK